MELRDYLRIMRAHWIVIVAATVLGATIGFGYSLMQPKVYTAEAVGIVAAKSADDSAGSAMINNQLAQSKVKSYVAMGSWTSVAEDAAKELGIDTPPEVLVKRVTVTNVIDTVQLKVTAQGPSPREAQQLAQAWLKGMANAITSLETGEAAKSGETAPQPGVGLVVGDSARLPTDPSSPNTRLNTLIGGLIGLALGIGYAFIRNTLDRRVRHPRDIEREIGVSVIGTLPLEKSLDGQRQVIDFASDTSLGISHHTIEAMRELRTNLQFIDVDNPPQIVVVTSSTPGDGKSTVAVNLASSLAAAGQWAILIDCDLRRPVIADIFGVPGDVGLTDILAGRAELQDVAHRPRADMPLAVVPAGRIPPNPSELLGSKRMREFLQTLSESAIVILDSPPVLPVTDAAVLAASADGVVVVASSGKTTFDMLNRAIENVQRTKGRVLGIVLNRVPRKGPGAAYYGKEYYGAYERYSHAAPTGERGTMPEPTGQ
ncbi:polysaccharide biosynthesis tyrosine autokinase [Microbacterium sp. NPDC057650]|uniref:polysaccharide biosynthesis tyrosine autokinase n=1 Tax=unclassified Microbacterium TaxID=2609290 RepID=UPI00366D35BB